MSLRFFLSMKEINSLQPRTACTDVTNCSTWHLQKCTFVAFWSGSYLPVQVGWCAASAVRWPTTPETAAWQQVASSSALTSWSAAVTAAPRRTASSALPSTWAGASCVREVSAHRCPHSAHFLSWQLRSSVDPWMDLRLDSYFWVDHNNKR